MGPLSHHHRILSEPFPSLLRHCFISLARYTPVLSSRRSFAIPNRIRKILRLLFWMVIHSVSECFFRNSTSDLQNPSFIRFLKAAPSKLNRRNYWSTNRLSYLSYILLLSCFFRNQALDWLVPVRSIHYYTYTPGLSTSSSTRSLTNLCYERSHLRVGFTLRCFQRLSSPDVATQRYAWRHNWYTIDPSTPVLSY